MQAETVRMTLSDFENYCHSQGRLTIWFNSVNSCIMQDVPMNINLLFTDIVISRQPNTIILRNEIGYLALLNVIAVEQLSYSSATGTVFSIQCGGLSGVSKYVLVFD